jgi:hypothetical protein
LNDVGLAVARLKLHHAQRVAAQPKAHGLGIHSDRGGAGEQAGRQIALM